MRIVEVMGIQLEVPTNQPVLMLRDTTEPRYLPLWIGTAEATAISLALEGVNVSRPLTHDLIADLISELGSELESVSISELRDGVFYAELNLTDNREVSARPSDAIAVALREGVTIYVAEDVMDEASVELELAGLDDDEPINEREEIEKFRAFLDDITPEDFS